MAENKAVPARLPFTDCRHFDGEPEEFWPSFGDALLNASGAQRALFLKKMPAPDGDAEESWKPFARCPATETGPFPLPLRLGDARFESISSTATQEGVATYNEGGTGLVALHLLTREPQPPILVLLTVEMPASTSEVGDRLISAQDVLLAYENHRLASQSRGEGESVTRVLDTLSAINSAERFTEAAMALCNSAAEHFGCERVSLGWIDGRYVRLKAVSGMDRFAPKMEAVQDIESCLEEAIDQGASVLFPTPGDSDIVSRAHQSFATLTAAQGSILSVPFDNGTGSGGIFLEKDGTFSDDDLRSLQVLADQSVARLAALKHDDRWFGARAATGVRKRCARLLGPEHTWAKIVAVVSTLTLAFLIFFPVTYKVEANFIVRSEDLQHMPAPFDGYIQTVTSGIGDTVGKGDVLLALDTGQLRLEESAALASIQRYSGEAQKAESEGRLADMLVSNSLREQSEATLEMARHRIAQAELRAPFEGVLVAGDFRDKIGAPVKTGEVLLRLTRLEDLYVELKIDERDIDELTDGASGRLAFTSQPAEKFGISLERIEPVAVPEAGGNVFVARARFGIEPQDWWRPGMTGVAKVEVGERSLLWIMSHRLVDFVRMKFWF